MSTDHFKLALLACLTLACSWFAWRLPSPVVPPMEDYFETGCAAQLALIVPPPKPPLLLEVADADTQLPLERIDVITSTGPRPIAVESLHADPKQQLLFTRQPPPIDLANAEPWIRDRVDLRLGSSIWVSAPGYVWERVQSPCAAPGQSTRRVELHKGGAIELLLTNHNSFSALVCS